MRFGEKKKSGFGGSGVLENGGFGKMVRKKDDNLK